MAKTGKTFDMNPDTFTLENLFAMELHNFKEVIGDIVTSAAKELSIEKVSLKLWFFIIANTEIFGRFELHKNVHQQTLSYMAFISVKSSQQ